MRTTESSNTIAAKPLRVPVQAGRVRGDGGPVEGAVAAVEDDLALPSSTRNTKHTR